ncbi:MAG: hypothetical protein R3331_05235 [Sulfurospirillaceae bacterium]|nr:hypothetical protein [Sulfurospirillaceae bacterium]
MRIFVSILLFITFLGSLVYLLLFTSSGNNLLKPYVKKVIEKKIDHNVSIESMTLKPDFIDFEIVVDKNSTLVLNGEIDIFKQNFNLTYKIDALNLKTPYVTIKNHMLLNGNINGDMKEYSINGKGIAFNSNMQFLVSIKNKKVRKLEINAKNLKIEDVLAFFNKPIYSQGVFNIEADLTSVDGANFDGTIKNVIYFGILNNQVIEKNFGLTLEDTISYKGVINSKIKDGIVYSAGSIFSNTGQIKFKKSEYDIKNKNLSLDYDLLLPSLDIFRYTIGQQLNGGIEVAGNLNIKDQNVLLKAESKKFGGDINLSVFNNTAELHFLGLKTQQVFDMLNTKRYANALMDGDVEISDLTNLVYKADIRVHDGKFLAKNMKDIFGDGFPQNTSFSLHVNSTKKDENITNNVDFFSSLLRLKVPNVTYDTKTQLTSGDYNLSIDKLENMQFVTNTKLRGQLDVDGNFTGVDNNVDITGSSKFLDSNSSFTYKDGSLDVKVKNLSALRLSHAAFLPEIFDSSIDSNISYDIASKSGRFNAFAKDGRFKKGESSDLILLLSGFDLTKQVFANTDLNGTVKNDDVNFTLNMDSNDSYLKIPKGYINLNNKDINSTFTLKIKDKDLSGDITGDIHKPKVNVQSSHYIQDKIEKAIEKNAPKELIEPFKNILKLLN